MRVQSGAHTCYVATASYDFGPDDGTYAVSLTRVSSGGSIELNSASGATPGVLRIEASGTTITVKMGGVTVITHTDANISGGQPGVRIGSGAQVDGWSGGDL